MINKTEIIIPVCNEEDNVEELYNQIKNVESQNGLKFHITFIDDGSTDLTLNRLKKLSMEHDGVKTIQLRRNYGKATALDIGFKKAMGDIVITMDGDLQDDPREIPRMIAKIDEGYDLVSGWKKKRFDPWHKTIPSKLFNTFASFISGIRLHDFNCGFKAYRKEVVENLNIYGDLYRYIPALVHWKGFAVTEIPIEHHARRSGQSKYGVKRLFSGFFDFLTIAFITKYFKRPMHLFGMIGLLLFVTGSAISLYLSVIWVLRMFFGFEALFEPIGNRPLLSLGILNLILGTLFISTGFLAEMIIHIAETTQSSANSQLIKVEFEKQKS